MDLPATQAMDDEDFVPTQKVTDDKESARSLIGTLIISDNLQHHIFSGNTIIGRQPECTIFLTDETVSKRHAEIEAESTERAIFIKDLGSSNKTKINDTRLRPNASYQIRNNDKLSFGKVNAIFKIHRPAEDSFVACTPQVNRRAVIPDTPDTSMNDSLALEGDVSTIPGTQTNEEDSCFRRPQIPVRTSISNEYESPKHVPFTLDDVPSPLSNSKDDNDISGVQTQKFIVDNKKEMTDNSIYTVETQKFVVSEKTSMHSYSNEDCKRALDKLSIKKVLAEELEKQSLVEDVETQEFVQTKFDSSSIKSLNRSIYNAQTQQILPRAQEDQTIQDVETQPFIPAKLGVDESNLADVSIHSAATQKTLVTTMSENKPIEDLETQTFIPAKISVDESNLADVSIHSAVTQKTTTTKPENKSIEDLETQPFTRQSFSSDIRKSDNTSIYNAETQKVIADVSNQSLDDIQTQKFDIGSFDSKTKSADVSIYSAETQTISENKDTENLETQKFESTRASLSRASHQMVKEDKNSISFSIQDIDTMPFTKYELPLNEKSNVNIENEDDDLVNSAAIKSENNKEVKDSEECKSNEQVATSSKKSDEPPTIDEVNENIVQNQEKTDETLSKSMSKSLIQNLSKFDKSKNIVESDDEEEIFSQNLIENCPFNLLLEDSKNENSTTDLQNDEELDKTVVSEHKIPSNNQGNCIVNEDLVKNKSKTVANDDSETDEEGVFSSNSFKEKENEKSHKESGNDSETDEEGVFSTHLTEEDEGEKLNKKPEGDSETDEEGVFSSRLSTNSKKRKNSNNNRIINESESEDEGVFSNNQSKNKATTNSVDLEENVTNAVGNSFANKSVQKAISLSPKMERSLDKVNEIVQADSPIPESDDDIFNENDEEKRTSGSGSDKTNDPATDKTHVDLMQKSSTSNTANSEDGKKYNDNNDVDDLAPTQIVETEDLSLVPTQIVNTNRAADWEEDRSEVADDLAPTQLLETEHLQNQESDAGEEKSDKFDELAPTQLIKTQNSPHATATVTGSVQAQAYNDVDGAPTQKMVEAQECDDSLAPTQKIVDTQIFSEEMGALQFSESVGPTQIIETEPNNVENEIVASPIKSSNKAKHQLEKIIETELVDVENKIVASPANSPNKSKRQPEEVKITSNKKLKTSDGSPKVDVDLNSTLEQNVNEMFEGSEVNNANIEEPMETQQLESILESNQIEESSVTNLDVSMCQSSPTLSSKRGSIRGKNRRRILALNKSGALNETPKPVPNLNDTIEHNLNELFDNTVDNVETPEPEPLLTQQLENVLSSSQDSSPIESKKEDQRRTLNVSRRRSILSLSSRSLNTSMAKLQNDEEKSLENVQLISQADTTSRSSLNEKLPRNKDYPANLDKDNVTSEKITSENDKDIVYRRGTLGYTETLKPVSTFDRLAFLDKYSSSDSQSDGDDIFKLRQSSSTPSTPSSKKRVSLRLKSKDLNSLLTLSARKHQDIEKNNGKSSLLSSKKSTPAHHRSAKKRNLVVKLDKMSSPLYRQHAKPVKRVMACGIIGFLESTLKPVDSEELVSAESTESENDLRAKVGLPSAKTVNDVEEVESEHLSTDSPMVDDKNDIKNEQLPIDSPKKDNKENAKKEQLPIDLPMEDDKDDAKSDLPMEDDKDDDSSDNFFKDFPAVKIANTVNNPPTSSQLARVSDDESDSESSKSLKIDLPDHWKWYAKKRFDVIYDKCKSSHKEDYESENSEDEEVVNNVTNDSLKDDQEERRSNIDKILAQVKLGKDKKKRKSNPGENYSSREGTVATRSRKLIKSKTPSPKPDKDSGSENDKTNHVSSSSSDNDSSEKLGILPKYKPVSPLKFDMLLLTKKPEDDDGDSKKEFQTPRITQIFKPMRPKPSPLKTRGRRKKACNNDVNDLLRYENNAVNKKRGNPIIETVVKDHVVFQGSRVSKTTATTTTRTSGSAATTIRTKRIIDSDDDDDFTHQPSPKRTKTLANRQKLQQVTVVISPIKDKFKKLREANQLNVVANKSSNFKQPKSTQANKRSIRAAKTLDNYVVVSKTSRTDSSDLSAVESNIVEDKSESKNKSKVKAKPASRTRKAKIDRSSERSANSSKENFEESDVQKSKTRGKRRRNQTTDSSVSGKESSRDELSSSDVENKSTRSTRGKLVRKNQAEKNEEKTTAKSSKAIQDCDSEESQKPKITVRKNTRDRSAKTVDKSSSSNVNSVADNKNDKIQDKDLESQPSSQSDSSQSESVTTRTTRTKKNKVNQELDSGSLETHKVAITRGSRRKPVNGKSKIVVKLTDVDSNKETMIKSDEIKEEVNVFKLMKKKMNVKSEEPSAPPARKTRARTAKNTTAVEESLSEESQEVSEIMKNSVLKDSKTTTRRKGRTAKTNSSYVENTESSDDVFEKPTSRPKRARMTKADKNKSSHVSDTDEETTQSSQRSTRKKHSPSPSPTLSSDAALVLTPSRPSRLSMSSPTKRPKVLFTGEKSEAHRQILTKLGGVETEEFSNCSVLITDKVRRTFKFLCSLAQGIPIASVKWLDESKKANHFLELEDYILNDTEAETKFKFNLKESLDKARKHKLLEGYTVVLSSKIKQPPISELKKMVTSSGGKPLVRAPAKWPEKSIVITTKEELDSGKKLIAKAPKSVTIQSVEFILTGILRQSININEFNLIN